jgi:cell division protein FtsB
MGFDPDLIRQRIQMVLGTLGRIKFDLHSVASDIETIDNDLTRAELGKLRDEYEAVKLECSDIEDGLRGLEERLRNV